MVSLYVHTKISMGGLTDLRNTDNCEYFEAHLINVTTEYCKTVLFCNFLITEPVVFIALATGSAPVGSSCES